MQKYSLNKTLLIIIFLGFLPLRAYPVEKIRNIVVLFSLNSNLSAYQNFITGLRSTISKNTDESRNLIIEFLDIDRITDEIYARHLIDIYNNKFKSIKIDLLITVGPGGNRVLQKHGLDALKTTPTIDIEVDMPGRIPQSEFSNKNRLEILIKYNFTKTLTTAFDLFPDSKKVYIIRGDSELDQFFNSIMDVSMRSFEKDHVFETISGVSLDSTLQIAKRIPAESIVLVPNYFADANKIPYTISEVLSFISANCNAPVFPTTDSFVDRGGIGGYVYSYISLGKETGRIANEMLNGKQAKDILVKDDFYEHIYNWKELKSWHLLRSEAIPGNSIFLNESFFSKYKYYTGGTILFLIAQTLLIFYLIRLNNRQKKISSQMLETEQMHRELIRGDRMAKMTELTASLSHELNQPLTAILYSAQAGKRFLQKDRLDQTQANEIFDNIIEDDKRAGKIINSVRNLMKPESREMEQVDLNSLILETNEITKSEAIRKGIRIKLNCPSDPVSVTGDKTQLQQVLMNLIRNSFNSMEESGTLNKIIKITLVQHNDFANVTVSDSGPGIDPEIREKIFKPFVTTRKNGSGIGLALSRSIIERHKGEIWAENIDGGGAQFSFKIRLTP